MYFDQLCLLFTASAFTQMTICCCQLSTSTTTTTTTMITTITTTTTATANVDNNKDNSDNEDVINKTVENDILGF